MKEGIHPAYKPSKVVCACGNTFETRSTIGDIHVEICAACHPFFTGKQKILDTAGRIERFRTRYAAVPAKVESTKSASQPPPPSSSKKAEAKENRAAKRAKANAGKPRPAPKSEAAPKSETAEAAAPDKLETPSAS